MFRWCCFQLQRNEVTERLDCKNALFQQNLKSTCTNTCEASQVEFCAMLLSTQTQHSTQCSYLKKENFTICFHCITLNQPVIYLFLCSQPGDKIKETCTMHPSLVLDKNKTFWFPKCAWVNHEGLQPSFLLCLTLMLKYFL